jgi:hypothetical protein
MTKLVSRPIDTGLNIAASVIAARLFPMGYDVEPVGAPESLEGLNTLLGQPGSPAPHARMAVWSGGSDATIFASREINYAFRAWHDWTHWRYQLPFTFEGECAAAFVQVAHLWRVYGRNSDTRAQAALLLCEVIGQGAWNEAHGGFLADQVAFTLHSGVLRACEALATLMSLAISDQPDECFAAWGMAAGAQSRLPDQGGTVAGHIAQIARVAAAYDAPAYQVAS